MALCQPEEDSIAVCQEEGEAPYLNNARQETAPQGPILHLSDHLPCNSPVILSFVLERSEGPSEESPQRQCVSRLVCSAPHGLRAGFEACVACKRPQNRSKWLLRGSKAPLLADSRLHVHFCSQFGATWQTYSAWKKEGASGDLPSTAHFGFERLLSDDPSSVKKVIDGPKRGGGQISQHHQPRIGSNQVVG